MVKKLFGVMVKKFISIMVTKNYSCDIISYHLPSERLKPLGIMELPLRTLLNPSVPYCRDVPGFSGGPMAPSRSDYSLQNQPRSDVVGACLQPLDTIVL